MKKNRLKDYLNFSDEELLDLLVDFGRKSAIEHYKMKHSTDKNGKKVKNLKIPKNLKPEEPLYADMMKDRDSPPPQIYIQRFGTWHGALERAGFNEHLDNPHRMNTVQEISDWVIDNTVGYSDEFVRKMFEGLDRGKNPKKGMGKYNS